MSSASRVRLCSWWLPLVIPSVLVPLSSSEPMWRDWTLSCSKEVWDSLLSRMLRLLQGSCRCLPPRFEVCLSLAFWSLDMRRRMTLMLFSSIPLVVCRIMKDWCALSSNWSTRTIPTSFFSLVRLSLAMMVLINWLNSIEYFTLTFVWLLGFTWFEWYR